MRQALENYESYVNGPDRHALGRFIVPFTRLSELEELGKDLLPRGKRVAPWRLSVLVADDVRQAGDEILRFNRKHASTGKSGRAVIDVAELKASTADAIAQQEAEFPDSLTAYFEIPLAGDVTTLVKAIGRAGARAKMRTGGVTQATFPPVQEIVDFVLACHRERVPFKATAGLHHPLRGERRLTYEPDSPKGYMYGFLNVFLAAVVIHGGETEDMALAILEETDPSAFVFENAAISWRDRRISVDQLTKARKEFAIAFGSCSFREPVDELAQLTRQARAINK
ncbi:MAG TPA: hypothetical protein VK648_02460 [Gemmatimonadaceae bacterium]|nr:hypothetical protein [Gemmatimonadaceae bacterium]